MCKNCGNVDELLFHVFGAKPKIHDESTKYDDQVYISAPANIYETQTAFTATLELPGMNKEEISVEVVKDFITIKGVKKTKPVTKPVDESPCLWSHIGRVEGQFQFNLGITPEMDLKKIRATYLDGVLTVEIARIPVDKTVHKVNIN